MNDEKLFNYIKGEPVSKAEILEVLDWIESSEENRKHYNKLKNVWVLMGVDKQSHKAPLTLQHGISKNRTQRFTIPHWLKYAAILVILLTVGVITFYHTHKHNGIAVPVTYSQVKVPNGEKTMVTLTDGTKIWLNSGSTLIYASDFGQEKRSVILTGEAFFDVAHDSLHPFIVHAANMDIRVLGTRFNVCAYADEKNIETTLEQGSVMATEASSGKEFTLKPGEQLVYSKQTKDVQKRTVTTGLYSSWKENLLRMEDMEFNQVISRLERWYGVKIIVDKNFDTKEHYTMTISNEHIDEIMKLISLTTKMNYQIKNDTIMIGKKK